jgi:hypothetical protein
LSATFRSAWFVNGTDDFTAAIRKDYFPYFAQGKTITITGLDLYDRKNVSKHHAIGNQAVWNAAAGVEVIATAVPAPDVVGCVIMFLQAIGKPTSRRQ